MHRFWILLLVLASFFQTGPVEAANVTTEILLDEMISFDRLTRMPRPAYRTVQFSSYDRRSNLPGGPDWFSNSDGFGHEPIPGIVRTVKKPDKDGIGTYVIAEINGPGAMVRQWTAAGNRLPKGINGEIRLYLDGETTPIFSGMAYDFLFNLYPAMAKQHRLGVDGLSVGFAQRDAGYYPIVFAKSCRVEWVGQIEKTHFYHIEMRTYAQNTTVETFRPEMLDTLRDKIKQVGATLADPGGKLKSTGESTSLATTIEPDKAATLFEQRGRSGIITRFEMKLKANNLNRALRQNILEITFDGHSRPQIESPLGDFFGAAPGINPYDSFPMEVRTDGTMICRFVMPFSEEVQCQLINRSNEPVEITGNVVIAPHPWDKTRDMHFFARWRVNHNMQLRGKVFDIPFLCARGAGRFVGCSVHLMNPSTEPTWRNWWGEGDEKIYVDDDSNHKPSFFGTGSEDYFNYSWGQPDLFGHAYVGQPRCDGPSTRGFIVNNRWHILDDIPFYQSINFFIEMYHHRLIDGFDYARISYFYGRPGILSDHMPLFREDLREPKRPDNWEPQSANHQVKVIYYQAEDLDSVAGLVDTDPQWSCGKRILFKPTDDGEKLSLPFDVAKSGKYMLSIVMSMTPNGGMCDVLLNGTPLSGLSTKDGQGELDLYTPYQTIARWHESEGVELKAGKNILTFVSRGKNDTSQGTEIGIDFIWIQRIAIIF